MLLRQSKADCLWKKKGVMVKEGEVVDFIPPVNKVGICLGGFIRYKLESRVGPYKLACGGQFSVFLFGRFFRIGEITLRI